MRILVFATLGVLLAAPTARAAEPEAEQHFTRGVHLYQETDFKGALVEFRRAYDISKNFRVLYNEAQSQYQALDYAGALATFERYLREGGDKVPHSRRTEVEQEIARLKTRTARVTIRVVQVGADVAIDDEKIGTSPLPDDAIVGAGVRQVSVTKDGYKPYAGTLAVAGGDTRKLDVNLVPIGITPEPPRGAAPTPAPGPAQPDAPRPAPRRIFWEGWAVTGALALGATVTGILAAKANGDLDEARARYGVSQSDLDSASSRTKTFSIVSDVCTVGALVAGGVSLYFTLKPGAPDKARVAVVPGGAVFAGSF